MSAPGWLGERTVFLALAGSQAHGTARAGSDVDVRGVCVAPLEVRLSLFEQFEQHDGTLPPVLTDRIIRALDGRDAAQAAARARTEGVVFDVAKFLRLCAAANPNTLEVLFAHPDDHLVCQPGWRPVLDARERFLTKRVHQTFLGYALAQLKRIRTHRSWLLSPPAGKPRRADFGLPESTGALGRQDRDRLEEAVAERVRAYGIDRVEMPKDVRTELRERLHELYVDALQLPASAAEDDVADALRDVAVDALGLPGAVVEVLEREKRYRSAMRHWESFRTWQRQRNPARAELERRHGYDTKHAMHLVRLMRMGLEVLRDQMLRVRRPDAEELLAIRDGALSYDELIEEATALQAAIAVAAQGCALPVAVDRGWVDELAMQVMTDSAPTVR